MPIYTYKCFHCGLLSERRQSVGERNRPIPCECGQPAGRIFEPRSIQIQTPEHFRHLQSDFLPDAGDTAGWEARQTSSNSHAPRRQTLKEAFDAVKQWS